MGRIKTSKDNRETYLEKATAILREKLFKPKGYKVPKVALSISWSTRGNRGSRRTTIGQCASTGLHAGGINHITITPALDGSTTDGTLRILGVLVHELVHAVDNCKSGHGTPFKHCATAVGLTGPMTATGESDWLKELLKAQVIKPMGLFPHQKVSIGGKKQSTRNIKVSCDCCGWSFRTSRTNINEIDNTDCLTGCGGELSWSTF